MNQFDMELLRGTSVKPDRMVVICIARKKNIIHEVDIFVYRIGNKIRKKNRVI